MASQGNSRLSAAAQFFAPEDESSQESDERTASDRIVELLNGATLAKDTSKKLEDLRVAQELLVNKDPNLIDNFLDEVMGFQKDRSQEVRKFVIGFIEEACKKDPELLPKVITNLQMMMGDQSVAIQKRVIQAMTHLYKVALGWLSTARSVTDSMEEVWNVICSIKEIIVFLLDSDNDGIRTQTIKFMEMVVITQTHTESESIKRPNDMSLDDVPLTLKIARPRKLEEEARQILEDLIKYHGSAHISSANLMTCMGSLSTIARLRPQFMSKVITALEALQANLPPTLARSQVSSVRKHLKNQLLQLLKHPVAAENFFTNITTLLTDLGASRDEVMKAMPKFDEMKRKARKKEREAEREAEAMEDESLSKRPKIDIPDEDDEEDEEEEKTQSRKRESAVDITEKFIRERMSPQMATEIVMASMKDLPPQLPANFANTFTPIAAAGTEGQIRHVSRLLATQLTAINLGPGVEEMRRMPSEMRRIPMDPEDEDDEESKDKFKISTVIGQATTGVEEPRESRSKKRVMLQPSGMSKKSTKMKTLKLSEITKPLSKDQKKSMMLSAIKRILRADKAAQNGGVFSVRSKIITTLAAQFSSDMKSVVLGFIFDDLPERADIAFSWLYEEYSFYQGFNRTASLLNRRDDSEYNSILCHLIRGVMERTEGKDKEHLLQRLYLESPLITEEAILLLQQFVQHEGNALVGVHLMKDLVMKRPTKQLNFLNSILEFCSHEDPQVRDTANDTVIQLYESNSNLANIIEEYSVMYLRWLLLPSPPENLFGEDRGRPIPSSIWTDDTIKVCLYLYLRLLPHNQKLLHHLAQVYVETTGEIKRTVLRVLETPVRSIGMDSPGLLDLVENSPKGAETLVTRIIRILTDKAPPSALLVDKVRELYKKRISDVRFLIPVLVGLSRQEIIAALPKLIKLNPVVIKEVFSRLLNGNTQGPLSAADLLIALHNIDPAKCDLKTVIKATALCMQDKQIYTQEVLAIVLQQLMEVTPIPTLLMRTVIQSVTVYPRLIGFVMNILQRLIVKKVWQIKMLWDGFIKCCERTVPQSYAVMLQLPPAQLRDLLNRAPSMREPLLEHVQTFTESQRAHVPANIMDVLYNVKQEPEETAAAPSAAEANEESNDGPPGEPAPPGI